jgi:long-chain acyl-CoA synthetase
MHMADVISPGAILPLAAARFGDKSALVTSTRTLTFRDLDTESERLAAALIARRVGPGDVVSLYT